MTVVELAQGICHLSIYLSSRLAD